MTRWFYTGSRLPLGGFDPNELAMIRADVVAHVRPGDEVGHGCCDGVDECVALTAKELGVPVTGFLPTSPRARNHQSDDAISASDRIEHVTGDELARNIAGVNWAEKVRALPLKTFKVEADGDIIVLAGSGTNHASRWAENHGKLDGWRALRS